MSELLATILAATGPGAPDVPIALGPSATFLPSRFDVDGLAAASVAAAGAGAADFQAARSNGEAAWVTVDPREASAAFVCERLLTPIDWELPAPWDPIAGDYRCGGSWIRLHTNYASHRKAALAVLGCEAERDAVASAVESWEPAELERAVVDAGGCAAALNSPNEWLRSEAGSAASREPLVRWGSREASGPVSRPGAGPFSGIRVLDLTRVIAGPVATRFLAAYGAEVLRIDPPGFEEVPALLPETTAGKRCAALDLGNSEERAAFLDLVRGADVLVCGLRPGALERLGLAPEELGQQNPNLITAQLDAYGWNGPWSGRRGFDSLVQMSTGIAFAGPGSAPEPLPAQALDHATGYLLAAAIGRALARRERDGVSSDIYCSLAATAHLLINHPASLVENATGWSDADTEQVETEWGAARRAPLPAVLTDQTPRLDPPAGPLGRDQARWIGGSS